MAVQRWNRIATGAATFINSRKVGAHEPTGSFQVIVPDAVLRASDDQSYCFRGLVGEQRKGPLNVGTKIEYRKEFCVMLRWSLLMAVTFLATGVHAGQPMTRLGLHFTQEELHIWRQRAQTGPYKSQGDVSVNSAGDWDRIVKSKNAFMANPSADHWKGWTVARPLTRNDTPGGSVGDSAWAHTGMLCASFYALVKDDAVVRRAVRRALLLQAAEAGVDFSNDNRWAAEIAGADQANFWGVAMWMGPCAKWPGFLFMFGQMEGRVNPYGSRTAPTSKGR